MQDLDLRTLSAIPRPSQGAILVATIGGVADIGMNWTLYGADDQFILVDAGTSFAPREVAGVEAIMPDPKLFKLLGRRLKGLVVTHFHEDHVGAIHRLWPRYAECPIYAPPFAAAMLTNRFQDMGTRGDVKLKTITPGAALDIGPFHLRTIKVAHSTPHCLALAIEHDGKRIIHTGDWKIDPAPGIGSTTDLDTFAALGRDGVDLMLCDSTNADRERPQTSEASVREAMTKVFQRAKGMVFVSSFGSNVARMASVAHAAKAAQRKVALAGRSLRNAAEVAEKLGLTRGVPAFLPDSTKFNGTQRRGCVLICTGTQGEENAALAKLAAKEIVDPRLPQVKPGDVVVHSARAIPGNEDYIDAVLDGLRAKGAKIITAENLIDGAPVHVTGHPCRTDLRAMYAAVRPRLAMPVHGTPMHLAAHADLARDLGVEALTPCDGGIYELTEAGLSAIGRLELGRVALLGDGAATLVPWSDAARQPVLSGPEAKRLEAHMRAESERLKRKMERLAGGDHRSQRGTKRGHRGDERPRGGRDPQRSAGFHAAEVTRPFTIETRNGRRRPIASTTPLPQSVIDGPQPF